MSIQELAVEGVFQAQHLERDNKLKIYMINNYRGVFSTCMLHKRTNQPKENVCGVLMVGAISGVTWGMWKEHARPK
jgi:hypothetical protein